MRIISQVNHADLPYERTSLCMDGNNIIARCDGKKYLMGVYLSKEKAIKAVEMCRKHYATAEYNRRIIPKGDTLVDMEIAKELLASGFIFQFPTDEEVEV